MDLLTQLWRDEVGKLYPLPEIRLLKLPPPTRHARNAIPMGKGTEPPPGLQVVQMGLARSEPYAITRAELHASRGHSLIQLHIAAWRRAAEIAGERWVEVTLAEMWEAEERLDVARAGIYWLRWFLVECTIQQLLLMNERKVYIGPAPRDAGHGWGDFDEVVERLAERRARGWEGA